MKPLRIAVYYPWIHLKGGIERSLSSLISRSRHDWTIFTSHFDPDNTFAEFQSLKVVKISEVSVRRDMGAVLKSALAIYNTQIPVLGFDAYVVWCDGLGTLTTLRNAQIPSFCICSTPLRPVYDPVYAREAVNGRKPLARFAYYLFKHTFRAVDRVAWSRFAGVVATSREVKARIVRNRLYPDDSRMVLLHPGIDIADAPAASAIRYEPFFLVPGRIAWTKNIQLAIDAFRQAELAAPWRLVVAGFVDRKSERYLGELQQRTQGHARIEFVAGPSDLELNRLYQNAYTVLFPPLNEDWGMAVLEGMLRSKPVIANASGGPMESVLDGVTGWLLEPNVRDWAALLRSLPERRAVVEEMGRQARHYVERYDWSNFVSGVDDFIASTVRKNGVSAATAVAGPAIASTP